MNRPSMVNLSRLRRQSGCNAAASSKRELISVERFFASNGKNRMNPGTRGSCACRGGKQDVRPRIPLPEQTGELRLAPCSFQFAVSRSADSESQSSESVDDGSSAQRIRDQRFAQRMRRNAIKFPMAIFRPRRIESRDQLKFNTTASAGY